MNLLGNTAIVLEGRLFGLDAQLLFDAAITLINVFIVHHRRHGPSPD